MEFYERKRLYMELHRNNRARVIVLLTLQRLVSIHEWSEVKCGTGRMRGNYGDLHYGKQMSDKDEADLEWGRATVSFGALFPAHTLDDYHNSSRPDWSGFYCGRENVVWWLIKFIRNVRRLSFEAPRLVAHGLGFGQSLLECHQFYCLATLQFPDDPGSANDNFRAETSKIDERFERKLMASVKLTEC